MKFRAAPEFDFDEWAELFRTDPQAFEARRKALIAIELAKGGAIAGPTARLLEALEARSAGADPAERMRLAAEAMLASSQALNARLVALSDELKKVAATGAPRAARPAPDGNA